MTFSFLHAAPGVVIPPRTLGIEAPPELAAQCDLGNLSGHAEAERLRLEHRLGDHSDFAARDLLTRARHMQGRAAVDIATGIPLPPDGTTFLFGGIDLDKLAAAAVLVLRQINEWGPDVWDRVFERVNRIATLATRPAEWSPRPLPTVEQPWPAEPLAWHEDRELAAVAAIAGAPLPGDIRIQLDQRGNDWEARLWGKGSPILRPVPGNAYPASAARWPSEEAALVELPKMLGGPVEVVRRNGIVMPTGLSLAERVAVVACWMVWGEPIDGVAWGDLDVTARIYRAACPPGPRTPDALPSRRLRDARARVEASRRALAEEAERLLREQAIRIEWRQGMTQPEPAVAIVRSAHPGALALGFCVAPVVVWIRPGAHCANQACWAHDGETCAAGHVQPEECPHAQRQVTIAGWAGPDGRTRYVDVERLGRELNSAEGRPGLWDYKIGGGSAWATPTLEVPGGTRLSEEAIVREVVGCLR